MVTTFGYPGPVSADDFAIDPLLVQSLVDAPDGLMRAYAYLAHFRKGELNLYFVSANHERHVNSETFGVIRRAFKKFPIRRVIVEGRPHDAGEVSSGSIERIVRESHDGFYQWGETDYAI